MKEFINRLKEGVSPTTLKLFRQRPDLAVNRMMEISKDMRQAAELLMEAHLIIIGLTQEHSTFACHEAALEWTIKHTKRENIKKTNSRNS